MFKTPKLILLWSKCKKFWEQNPINMNNTLNPNQHSHQNQNGLCADSILFMLAGACGTAFSATSSINTTSKSLFLVQKRSQIHKHWQHTTNSEVNPFNMAFSSYTDVRTCTVHRRTYTPQFWRTITQMITAYSASGNVLRVETTTMRHENAVLKTGLPNFDLYSILRCD